MLNTLRADFLPNYEDMMEKSLKTGGGGDGGGSSFVSNFSSVNDMLKGFMELQKEQLKVDLAKTKANKAKVDLAMDYQDDSDYQDEDEDSSSKFSRAALVRTRIKASGSKLRPIFPASHPPLLMKTLTKSKEKAPFPAKVGLISTAKEISPMETSLMSKEKTIARFNKLIKGLLRKKGMMSRFPSTVGEESSRLIKDKLDLLLLLFNYFKSNLKSGKDNTKVLSRRAFPGPFKMPSRKRDSKRRRQQWPGMNGKYFRRQAWPGSVDDGGPPAKYFKRRDQQAGDSQQSGGAASGGNSQSSSSSSSSGPDSTFWESWVKKYKDSPPSSGAQGSATSQGSPSEAFGQSGSSPPSPTMPSGTSWQGGTSANKPSLGTFGSAQGAPPPNNPWSGTPPMPTTSSPSQQGWPPPPSASGSSGGQGSSQGSNGNSGASNQRKRQIGMSPGPVHGAVRIDNIPGITSQQADVQATNNNGDNIPYLSFALNPTTTPLPTTTPSTSTKSSKVFIVSPPKIDASPSKCCNKNKILMLPSTPMLPRLPRPPPVAPASFRLTSNYPYDQSDTDLRVLSYNGELPLEEKLFPARPLLSQLRPYKQQVPFGSVRPGKPVVTFASMVNSLPRLENDYLVRLDRTYDEAEEPLAIYQVSQQSSLICPLHTDVLIRFLLFFLSLCTLAIMLGGKG